MSRWGLTALLATILAAGCSGARTDPRLEASLQALGTQVGAQSTQLAQQGTWLSYLATQVPPRPPTPSIRPEPTPFVLGLVIIEEGRCCVGGLAGQPLQIRVRLQADSPAAPVNEMRVRAGIGRFTVDDFAEGDWVPFVEEMVFDFAPPLNWVGFTVSAQFRDARGNRSAVVWDDISVEGMPGPTVAP